MHFRLVLLKWFFVFFFHTVHKCPDIVQERVSCLSAIAEWFRQLLGSFSSSHTFISILYRALRPLLMPHGGSSILRNFKRTVGSLWAMSYLCFSFQCFFFTQMAIKGKQLHLTWSITSVNFRFTSRHQQIMTHLNCILLSNILCGNCLYWMLVLWFGCCTSM